MAVINLRGKQSEVDIEYELRLFDWNNARWSSNKLVASSPFRSDNAPSFFVNLNGEYAGVWGDSGAVGQYEKGNFTTLLGYLRGTSSEEAAGYLLDKYGALYEIRPDKPIKIRTPSLKRPSVDIALAYTVTPAISPYLITRGIGADVQEAYGVGYNPHNKGYTAMPWHYHDTGAIANVKYRHTASKRFFYEPDAKSVSELVYGLWQAKGASDVVICEAEIDVMSWAMAGYAAIALGGAHISDRQAELIIREGFKRIYLGGDNDEQGRLFNRSIADKLRGYAELLAVDYGSYNAKDANDVLLRHGVAGLRCIHEKATPVRRLVRG